MTAKNLVVLAIISIALVVCALADLPEALMFVLMPVSFVAAACAGAAAARPRMSEPMRRATGSTGR